LCAAAAVTRRGEPLGELALIAIASFASTLLLSIFTVTGLSPLHLVIIYPAAGLVLASGMEFALEHSPRANDAMGLAVLIVAASSLLATAQYKSDLLCTGGAGNFSDAINGLEAYLESVPGAQAALMDWGFNNNLYVLSGGKINAENRFGWQEKPGPEFRLEVRRLASRPGTLFVFHAEGFEVFKRSAAFAKTIAATGRTLSVERTFYQRDGKAVIVVYGVE
jgi:hypothetical protein